METRSCAQQQGDEGAGFANEIDLRSVDERWYI